MCGETMRRHRGDDVGLAEISVGVLKYSYITCIKIEIQNKPIRHLSYVVAFDLCSCG